MTTSANNYQKSSPRTPLSVHMRTFRQMVLSLLVQTAAKTRTGERDGHAGPDVYWHWPGVVNSAKKVNHVAQLVATGVTT